MSEHLTPGGAQLQGVLKALHSTQMPAMVNAKLRVIEVLDHELARTSALLERKPEKIYLYDVMDQLRTLLIAHSRDLTK